MKKLSLQLHALPEEVTDLLSDPLNDPNIFVVTGESNPIRFCLKENNKFEPSKFRVIIFTTHPPKLEANSVYDFIGLNPEALVFEIGHITQNGLAESWLAAVTTSSEVEKRWRQVVKSIRSATLSGALAMNPNSGATVPIKGHRFTIGAQKAFLNGVKILPSAGNSIVMLSGNEA